MEYVYEVKPRQNRTGVDLISDALPFGRLWFGGPNSTDNAVNFVKFYGRAADLSIRVFGLDGNLVNEYRQKKVGLSRDA